jgi:hypothetical protein
MSFDEESEDSDYRPSPAKKAPTKRPAAVPKPAVPSGTPTTQSSVTCPVVLYSRSKLTLHLPFNCSCLGSCCEASAQGTCGYVHLHPLSSH